MKQQSRPLNSFPLVFWCLLLLGIRVVCAATVDKINLDTSPWYQRLLVGMEVGPTGAQSGSDGQNVLLAKRFNGRDIVQASVRAHAQYIVIWGRDSEWTYYNSKIEPKAPGLRDRDVLQEAVDEARKHNMPVIVYCVLQYPNQTLRQHPDWKARDHNGNSINHLVCFNSPYRDYVLPGLIEDTPIYRVSIQLNRPFEKVKAVNAATQIKITGQTIELLVEDIHDIVVINYLALSEKSVVGPPVPRGRSSGFSSGKDGEAGDIERIVDSVGRSPDRKQAGRSQIDFPDRA